MTRHIRTGGTAGSKGVFLPFLFVFALLAVLSYVVSFPLLRPLCWSALLSYFVHPLYRFLHRRFFHRKWNILAAAITTAAIILLLVIPSAFLGITIAREGIRIYGLIADQILKIDPGTALTIEKVLPQALVERLQPFMDKLVILEGPIRQGAAWAASSLASASRTFIENGFRLFYQLIVIAVASFFMLKDGHVLIDFVQDITPLSSEQRRAFFERIERMLNAMMYGIVLTAGIQGALGMAGWLFVGLPSPAFFALVMFILAMIPFIGTPLVWGPAAFYLMLTGEIKSGIILFVWGLLVVSSVDNFIRPIFISEGSKVHILIVFIGVVGGLASWGFLGLFLGPLILTMFVFILDAYRQSWRTMRSS